MARSAIVPSRPASSMTAAEWESVFHLLQCRSGNTCEVRSPDCAAGPGGDLSALTRDRVSVHHRLPRGSGGTSGLDPHRLSRLLLLCGDGVKNCHGWVESHREEAYEMGWLVKHRGADDIDTATVPVWIGGRRRVFLDDDTPFYLDGPLTVDESGHPDG